MTSYAVGILHEVDVNEEIVEYLQRIDATLAPYDGHFIIHGGDKVVAEGTDPGAVIVIEFPDHQHVEDWYRSDAYQAILPLRTRNANSTVFAIDGVDRDHLATDVLTQAAASSTPVA